MKTRLSRSLVAVLALAALAGAACTQPAAPSPTINININNIVQVTTTVSFASPVASEKAGCAAIGQLEINRPESLAVGAKGDVLVTPRDSSGQKRTHECDIADGITISPNPTDILSIEDPHAFVTKVTGGPKSGTGKLSITVGRASAAVEIPVK